MLQPPYRNDCEISACFACRCVATAGASAAPRSLVSVLSTLEQEFSAQISGGNDDSANVIAANAEALYEFIFAIWPAEAQMILAPFRAVDLSSGSYSSESRPDSRTLRAMILSCPPDQMENRLPCCPSTSRSCAPACASQ